MHKSFKIKAHDLKPPSRYRWLHTKTSINYYQNGRHTVILTFSKQIYCVDQLFSNPLPITGGKNVDKMAGIFTFSTTTKPPPPKKNCVYHPYKNELVILNHFPVTGGT